jgi:hypothetical protein
MMDILSMLQMLDQADSINRIGQGISQQVQPISDAMDRGRMKMADFFGDTKTMVDEGDASEYTVMDEKAFNDRMGNIAKASAGLAQMPEMKPGVLSPQVISSPAPMGQAPNPYAPVNYGTMPYQQGGIGRAPSMEEILKALQSRGQ